MKKYPDYPIVLDWLQWGKFSEKLGEPDYPKIALELLSEFRADLRAQEKRIEKLKAALRDIVSEGHTYICNSLKPSDYECSAEIAEEALAEDDKVGE